MTEPDSIATPLTALAATVALLLTAAWLLRKALR